MLFCGKSLDYRPFVRIFLCRMSSDNKYEVLLTNDSSGQLWNSCVWDPLSGSTLTTFKGSVSASGTTCYVKDSFVVSAQPSKPLLNVWQVNRHEQRPLKYTTPGQLNSLATSPCGHFLAGSNQEKIYLWQISTGKLIRIVSGGHYQKVTRLCFTNDGSHLISGGDDGNVLAWNLDNLVNKNAEWRHLWNGHALPVSDMFVGQGGAKCRVFTVSHDQTAKVFCLASGQMLLEVTFSVPLTSISLDSSEKHGFVGTKSGPIHVFCLNDPPRDLKMTMEADKQNSFVGHTSTVNCLSVSLDGLTLASGSADHDVRLWHVKSRQCTRVINHKGPVNYVKFMTPPRGMLDPDNYKPAHILAPLEKTEAEKDFYKRQDFGIEYFTNDNLLQDNGDDDDIDDILKCQTSDDKKQESAFDTKELASLKAVNQELYAYALKSILTNK